MEIMYERCCGIDVHKRTIVACLKCGNTYEVRSCGTTSEEIRTLVRWLLEAECQMAAVEGTSAYSNAIYNACEVSHMPIMLVDSRYMKYVPGRNPGLKDAEWMADLLQYGVLKVKHVQKREQRDLGGVFDIGESCLANVRVSLIICKRCWKAAILSWSVSCSATMEKVRMTSY